MKILLRPLDGGDVREMRPLEEDVPNPEGIKEPFLKVLKNHKGSRSTIQKLKHDLEMRQPRNMLNAGGSGVSRGAAPPIINLGDPPRIMRRVETLRADPNDLLHLGDPDVPTPSFTEEIMNAHISKNLSMPILRHMMKVVIRKIM